jgi:hypothetical protein
MNWDDAKKTSESIGDGWRLPNVSELNVLCKKKENIGGFSPGLYWSNDEDSRHALILRFYSDRKDNTLLLKDIPCHVRLVKSYKKSK